MSTLVSTSYADRRSLLRLIVLGGLIIGAADAVIYHGFITIILRGNPLTTVYQYIASGALGVSAFADGIATAMLGVLFHFIISLVIAGVFILSAIAFLSSAATPSLSRSCTDLVFSLS
jgi:hypothetical protein